MQSFGSEDLNPDEAKSATGLYGAALRGAGTAVSIASYGYNFIQRYQSKKQDADAEGALGRAGS